MTVAAPVSTALCPATIMPGWLRVTSKVNPLTYEVNALRALLIGTATAVAIRRGPARRDDREHHMRRAAAPRLANR